MSAAADLAALASDVRARVPALEAVMPAEDARRESLLELAAAYSRLVSYLSASVALLAYVLVRLGVEYAQAQLSTCVREPGVRRYLLADGAVSFQDRFELTWWAPSLVGWLGAHAVGLLIGGLLAVALVRGRATARFVRVVEFPDPVAAARHAIARVAHWLAVIGPVGVTAFALWWCASHVFGVNGLPPRELTWMSVHQPRAFAFIARDYAIAAARFDELCGGIVATAAASIWAARRRPRWLRSRAIGYVAAAIAAVVLAAAVRLGDVDYRYPAMPFDTAFYPIVLAAGAASMWLCTASLAARARLVGGA